MTSTSLTARGGQPRIDLHTHSNRSDGTDSPTGLVVKAKAAGLTVVALTDHDTTDGWAEAVAAAQHVGVELLRGIELSVKCDERSQHLLAYEPDPEDEGLRTLLSDGAEARRQRARDMVALIRLKPGLSRLSYEDVEARAAGGVPGRPHIADALLDLLPNADRATVFAKYLAPGTDTYVFRPAPAIEDALRVVVQAGGVPVLAHPWGRGRGSLTHEKFADLQHLGLAGLEVDHVEHSCEDREELHRIAADLGLVVTGSSDYHGTRKPNQLGCETTAPDQYERLRVLCSVDYAAR